MDNSAEITWSNQFPGSATYSISRAGIKSRSELPSSNWTKFWADIAETSKTVPTSRTVNGTPLSSDVTLTGADIAVSGSDATKISAALAGKASKSDVDPLLFAQYYPDGSVKSAAEFTSGIKYNNPDTTNRTITVKPFCNTGVPNSDNSSLVGRVVIPPFVDASGNPYISDDGTRFKVVGVSDDIPNELNRNLTAIVAPTTVTSIGDSAFENCRSLTAVSFPAVTSIGYHAFAYCYSLASVDFGDTPRSSVPTLDGDAFYDVPTSCTIIVPYTQYDEWKAASGWSSLPQEFVRHAEKADKPATFTAGNLAALDAQGNPTDSGKKPSDFQSALTAQQLANIAAVPNKANAGDLRYALGTIIGITSASSEVISGETVYYGAATLADRTENIVGVTVALDELRVTIPPAVSGKVRDFGLLVAVGLGEGTALAAPALVPVAPTGETITLMNAEGEMPTLADGTTTASGVTVLYFTEVGIGTFLVKGEQIQEVA